MTVIELKRYIFRNQKIEYVLSEIGCGHIVYHTNKDYFSCSNVNGDNITAINIKNNEYLNCKNYTREKSFDKDSDLLTLVQYNLSLKRKNITFWDVLKYLHKILGLKLSLKKETTNKSEDFDPLHIFKKVKLRRGSINVLDFETFEEDILCDFVPHIHIDWYKEGIMPWTVKKFCLAYSYKYKRNVIPLRYWLTGELMGFNMRTTVDNFELFGIKKYFLTPGYPKQINIFGLWENKSNIEESEYVVVFESEKSVLKRDSLNDHTGVAVSGHEISDEQARILISLNKEIIICFDNDVDINHIRCCCEKFYHIRKTSYIRDRWGLLGKKDSPADIRNQIYEFMVQYRMKYNETEHREYLKSLRK